MPFPWHLTPDTRQLIPGIWHIIHDTWHRYLAPGTWHLIHVMWWYGICLWRISYVVHFMMYMAYMVSITLSFSSQFRLDSKTFSFSNQNDFHLPSYQTTIYIFYIYPILYLLSYYYKGTSNSKLFLNFTSYSCIHVNIYFREKLPISHQIKFIS